MWIDFKLYFYVRIHKWSIFPNPDFPVVNWFQIVFLREDSQVPFLPEFTVSRCELISNCIFTWGFTRRLISTIFISKLWIDFKLYFYVRIHKQLQYFSQVRLVVNWFQIVFLREDSQDFQYKYNEWLSCELISNCIFTWGFTREKLKKSLER